MGNDPDACHHSALEEPIHWPQKPGQRSRRLLDERARPEHQRHEHDIRSQAQAASQQAPFKAMRRDGLADGAQCKLRLGSGRTMHPLCVLAHGEVWHHRRAATLRLAYTALVPYVSGFLEHRLLPLCAVVCSAFWPSAWAQAISGASPRSKAECRTLLGCFQSTGQHSLSMHTEVCGCSSALCSWACMTVLEVPTWVRPVPSCAPHAARPHHLVCLRRQARPASFTTELPLGACACQPQGRTMPAVGRVPVTPAML